MYECIPLCFTGNIGMVLQPLLHLFSPLQCLSWTLSNMDAAALEENILFTIKLGSLNLGRGWPRALPAGSSPPAWKNSKHYSRTHSDSGTALSLLTIKKRSRSAGQYALDIPLSLYNLTHIISWENNLVSTQPFVKPARAGPLGK